jgi:hypothetical protein
MPLFGNKDKTCKGKVRFSSDAAAQAALKKINPTRANNKPRRVYKCPRCGGWHLTSKNA